MVKHIQTIRRQIADELFDVFDHFLALALEMLTKQRITYSTKFTLKTSFSISFESLKRKQQEPKGYYKIRHFFNKNVWKNLTA